MAEWSFEWVKCTDDLTQRQQSETIRAQPTASEVKEVKEVKDELRGEVKRPIEGDVIAKPFCCIGLSQKSFKIIQNAAFSNQKSKEGPTF